MRRLILVVVACLMPADALLAQTVVRQDELLHPDRPEAWAMNRATAASLMTAFGETPILAPGRWHAMLELGHIPRLSAAQQRVGFYGSKDEDLNKSPVFGRVRLVLGLPAGWAAELGYTPPLGIEGVRSRDLVAFAIGRRIVDRERYTLSVRAFGQHGTVSGDITCPAELAGVDDIERNPYGCQAPSKDRVALNHYGIDLTSSWRVDPWRWHAGLGLVRTEPEVQVDALTFDFHDRSRLVTRDVLSMLALGVNRDLDPHWSVGVEVLHVPLSVERRPGAGRERDSFTSARLQVRYRRD